jgi:diguanylate cyclase (GGDEF)-like protein
MGGRRPRRAGFFGAAAVCRLPVIAQHAAPVVHNSLVFERAQEASLTDPLTGLLNRRALQQEVTRLLSGGASDPSSRLVVLMLDLDGLKHFNDTFGHHVGDRAIREVGRVLRGQLRHDDLCARYAGDEFVVVLRHCDRIEGQVRARELQEAVAAVRIDVRAGEGVNLSISVGGAASPEDGQTPDALIAAADSRMYRDKVKRKGERGHATPGRDAA